MHDLTKSTFENINDLIRIIIWPSIIIGIFVIYRSHINDTIKQIPGIIKRSSKISFRSVVLDIQNAAKVSGNGELGRIIQDLSEKGIKRLLTLGSGSHSAIVRHHGIEEGYVLPFDIDALQELERKGLIKTKEPLKEFLSFYDSLNPIKTIVYLSKNGKTNRSKREDFDETVAELFIGKSALTAEQNHRIEYYSIQLSPDGQKAFDIIINVVAEQINKG